MQRTFPKSPLCTALARKRITTGRRSVALWSALAPAAFMALGVSAAETVPSLKISNAWVRAMPPGQAMTAAYMTLENPGEGALLVDGVEASAGKASLHETRRRDGRVQMVAAGQVQVPAGGAVYLEPGGLHVMLTGLARTPAAGETVTLCVTGSAPRACVDAPVLRDAPDTTASRNNGEHGHHGR